ncbi:unnamed protein product [Prunus armeniaca]
MDVIFYADLSYFVAPTSPSLQGKSRSEEKNMCFEEDKEKLWQSIDRLVIFNSRRRLENNQQCRPRSFSNKEDLDEDLVPEVTHDVSEEQLQNTTPHALPSSQSSCDEEAFEYNVKNAFLHRDSQEVYMDPPPRILMRSGSNTVCKLRKSLYGLKQSPRAWFGRFTASIKRFGYTQSNSDHTLLLKRRNNKLATLIIYVDDMVVTSDDKKEMKNL